MTTRTIYFYPDHMADCDDFADVVVDCTDGSEPTTEMNQDEEIISEEYSQVV